MTPFDVVKIRLQAQQKEFMKSKCFVYCNGVMDVVCFCPNGQSKGNVCKVHGKPSFKRFHTLHHNINSSDIKHLTDNLKDIWYRRPSQFKGTLVSILVNSSCLNHFNSFLNYFPDLLSPISPLHNCHNNYS